MDTIDYYNQNYQNLLKKYDNANVFELHNLFKKYIKNGFYVLDIGFGSGRDLSYIKNITSNIFGLDASVKFVNNLKNSSFFKSRIFLSKLPNLNISKSKVDKFDVIISIAVLMHLDKNNISKTIKNLKDIVKQNGKIIISYSTKSRDNDDRTFHEISKKEMTELFIDHQFKELECVINNDKLNRDIQWVTQVFEVVSTLK